MAHIDDYRCDWCGRIERDITNKERSHAFMTIELDTHWTSDDEKPAELKGFIINDEICVSCAEVAFIAISDIKNKRTNPEFRTDPAE